MITQIWECLNSPVVFNTLIWSIKDPLWKSLVRPWSWSTCYFRGHECRTIWLRGNGKYHPFKHSHQIHTRPALGCHFSILHVAKHMINFTSRQYWERGTCFSPFPLCMNPYYWCPPWDKSHQSSWEAFLCAYYSPITDPDTSVSKMMYTAPWSCATDIWANWKWTLEMLYWV